MDNFSLSIVFSTRKINNDFVEHLKKSCACPDLELLIYENNGEKSLTEIYDEALNKAKNDIIVFCHDDLIFETPYWGKKLIKHFKRNPEYGIIGVAGTDEMVNGKWWEKKESMHGIVNHTNGIKKWTSTFSKDQGNKIKQMVCLDGLFFAVDKTKIKVGFDELFKGFHFYDISFFIPNHLSGVKIGVITDIRLTHLSVGNTNTEWLNNKQLFESKYAYCFPIKIVDSVDLGNNYPMR